MRKPGMVSLLLLISSPYTLASESSLSQCLEEYQQGHLEKALYYCHNAASYRDAQLILGKLYTQEGAESPEMKKAFDYFSAAASQHQPDAQFMLALCYQNGIGVSQDTKKAAYWYEQARLNGLNAPAHKAELARPTEIALIKNIENANELAELAEKGHTDAEYQMGRLYAAGRGVPQDDGKALLWFKKAADKNHQGAQNYLAWMNMLGLGITENKEEAIRWFTLANQHPAHTQEIVADELDELFSTLPDNENTLVNRSAQSEYRQGVELFESRLNEQDHKDGLTLLEKAADENYVPAQLYLGKLYYGGHNVEKDHEKAVKLYTQAALNGSHEAQYALGWMYFNGEGVAQSNDEALEWFNLAKESEDNAKAAMKFIEAQRPAPIELGNFQRPETFKVKMQRAGSYLKSLLPSKTSSS